MIIVKMTTFLETYVGDYAIIRTILTEISGSEHSLATISHKDDLKSNFQLQWEVAGERLQEYLKSKDWEHEALSNASKTV